MSLFANAQGFYSERDGFIAKEISLYDGNAVTVYRYSAPYSWLKLDKKSRKTNALLTRRFHGLKWTDGNIKYSDIGSTLADVRMLYVAGVEQAKIFTKYCHPEAVIIDLQDDYYLCPSFKSLGDRYADTPHCCNFCDRGLACSQRRVMLLCSWIHDRNI